MANTIKTHFANPKTIVHENDIKVMSRFLKRKFAATSVNIEICEVEMADRVKSSVSHSSLDVFNKIKINATDYLGKFSLKNVCTPRGDNRIRDERGKVFYITDAKVEQHQSKVTLALKVVSSHNLVSFFENLLNRLFKANTSLPTHMVRTIRQSLVYAKKEDRGDLDGDVVNISDE